MIEARSKKTRTDVTIRSAEAAVVAEAETGVEIEVEVHTADQTQEIRGIEARAMILMSEDTSPIVTEEDRL